MNNANEAVVVPAPAVCLQPIRFPDYMSIELNDGTTVHDRYMARVQVLMTRRKPVKESAPAR